MGQHRGKSIFVIFVASALISTLASVEGAAKKKGKGNKIGTFDSDFDLEVKKEIEKNLYVVTDIEEGELEADNLTAIYMDPVVKAGRRFRQRQQGRFDPATIAAITGGIGVASGGLGVLKDGVEAVWGVVKAVPEVFKGFYEIIKTTQDILKLLGLDTKHNAILVDNLTDGKMWLKCWGQFKSTEWHDLEDEGDGFIIRFVTHLGHNLFSRWACAFRKDGQSQTFETNVYGGDTPRTEWNLYVAKKNKINRIDFETKRIDGLGRPIRW